MLTAFQCETVAGYTVDGEILCLDCASDEFTKPLSRYSLDEEESARAEGQYLAEDDEENHVAECDCTLPLFCDQCSNELTEGYTDTRCEEKQDESE